MCPIYNDICTENGVCNVYRNGQCTMLFVRSLDSTMIRAQKRGMYNIMLKEV